LGRGMFEQEGGRTGKLGSMFQRRSSVRDSIGAVCNRGKQGKRVWRPLKVDRKGKRTFEEVGGGPAI